MNRTVLRLFVLILVAGAFYALELHRWTYDAVMGGGGGWGGPTAAEPRQQWWKSWPSGGQASSPSPSSSSSSSPSSPASNATDMESGKVVVLAEHKWEDIIPFVINNAFANLAPDWKMQFFLTPDMVEQVRNHPELKPFFDAQRITLIPTLNPQMTRDDYSRMLKTVEFWTQIQGERVLTIQTDSVMCAKAPKRVEDFFEYDYVGAPWPWHPQLKSGNGGFSLRRRSVMIESCKLCPATNVQGEGENEDLWFGLCWDFLMKQPGSTFRVKLPELDVANSFSVENYFHPHPLGFHKPWWGKHWPKNEADTFASHCPEMCKLGIRNEIHGYLCSSILH